MSEQLRYDKPVVSYLSKEVAMPQFIIEFDDRDTTPERLDEMASEHGLTPEELIHRFIAQGMGGYGLREVSDAERESMTSIDELFVASGALKPKP